MSRPGSSTTVSDQKKSVPAYRASEVQPPKKSAVPWILDPPKGKETYALGFQGVRQHAVKDVFHVRSAVNENIEQLMSVEYSYVFEKTAENVRLILAVIAVGAAALSYMSPIPFPEVVPLLIACISVYYICSGLMFVMIRFVEGDAFLMCGPPNSTKALRFSSKVVEFEPRYEITVEVVEKRAWYLPPKVKSSHTVVWRVGELFSEDGFIFPPAIRGAVQKLLADAKWS